MTTVSREVLWELTGHDYEGYTRLGTGETTIRRWSTETEVFFADPEGSMWGALLERPATECQDGMDFEENVHCYPVEAVQTTTYRKACR